MSVITPVLSVSGIALVLRQELSQDKAPDRLALQTANKGHFEGLPHTWSGRFSGDINYWDPRLAGCLAHYYNNTVTVVLVAYDESVNSGRIEMTVKGQTGVVMDSEWTHNELLQCVEQIGIDMSATGIIYGLQLRQDL